MYITSYRFMVCNVGKACKSVIESNAFKITAEK